VINITPYVDKYDAVPHTATGTATGVNIANLNAGLSFASSFTDAPGGTTNWTFNGGTNYNNQTGSTTVTINKADATIVITPYVGTYDGIARTASGTATGVNNANLNAGLSFASSFTNVPGGTTNWTFNGGNNYNNKTGSTSVTINKSNLAVTIKVNDTYVNQGATPTFTFTTTPTVTVSSVTYQVRNSSGVLQTSLSTLSPGTYSVTAVNPVIANSNNINYIVTSVPGILIVNPSTGSQKPIRTILDCVTVADPATNGGFGYIANFSYTNDNATDIWITANSADNRITPTGSFVDTRNLPNIFKAGGGKVKIPFDGTKITWIVSSFDKNKKTSSTSDASSTSAKCPNGFTPSMNNFSNIDALALSDKDRTYPNPVLSRVYVETDLSQVTEKDVRIVDLQGRELRAAQVRKISATKMEVDLSNLTPGQYYIRISNQSGMKVFRILKQ
jgi:hypothetical protein